MFAQRGINGVSMREIGLAANQRNNGATQYHFGDKAGLIRAVFERRAATVNDRRLLLLAEQSATGRDTVHSLVRAYVTPLSEQVALGTWYVPFLARLQAEHQRDELLERVGDPLNTGYSIVRKRLRTDHLADVDAPRFAIRWRIALNLAIDALADHQTSTSARRPSLQLFTEELIESITALLGRSSGRG
ncbi:MAG: TetR family transcriptional regulator [Ilumatobacteraceae bacterium]|nr:TetR family transcriptional regulator [Ilumatobacteraceae bacterium]